MTKLVKLLGYTVEAFPSAADFLVSPSLAQTACLVTDVHMPGMTGVELHRHLVETGYAIPTILVTAYPDEVVRDRGPQGFIQIRRTHFQEAHARTSIVARRSNRMQDFMGQRGGQLSHYAQPIHVREI